MYNQYPIGYWIMRIAVYTKSSLTGHPVRSKLLAELSRESGLLLTEIPQGSEIPAGFDRLLAFGGDGTMLEAAVRAARADVPLVGVNIGNLGFLTQFDAKVDAKTLAAALECESVTRRMLIECTADGKSYLALNDIVVKSASARPVSIELRVNGQFSDAYGRGRHDRARHHRRRRRGHNCGRDGVRHALFARVRKGEALLSHRAFRQRGRGGFLRKTA